MKSQKILLCGSIAIDRIMNFDGVFKNHIDANTLDILSISLFLKDLKDVRGGVAANIAYSLALLGEKPTLVGSVGSDCQQYIGDLGKLGIDTSAVHFSNLPTASFNCISDNNGCQIGGFYPGAMFDSSSLTVTKWRDLDVFVVLSPHDPKAMLTQIRDCKAHKMRMFFDIGQQVSNASKEVIEEGVNNAELLIINEHEIEILCKKVGLSKEKLKQIVPVVITTLGEKGSIIEGSTVRSPIQIKIAKPVKVSDPTGAGDGYRAGFLYGYVRNWELKTCGQMGALLAAFVLENYGAQGHKFTTNEFINRYKDTFGEELNLIINN